MIVQDHKGKPYTPVPGGWVAQRLAQGASLETIHMAIVSEQLSIENIGLAGYTYAISHPLPPGAPPEYCACTENVCGCEPFRTGTGRSDRYDALDAAWREGIARRNGREDAHVQPATDPDVEYKNLLARRQTEQSSRNR